jgi:hypothetical protein
MALTNMKLTKKQAKSKVEPIKELEGPMYPYGLNISLCEESLGKLNMSAGDFKVGSTMSLDAKVKVKVVRDVSSDDGDYYESSGVDLQITDLSLE